MTQINRTKAFEEFQAAMQIISDRAKNLSNSIIAEARETARKAGLSPDMPFLHAHNALCSLEYGKPWQCVDYSLARKVLWLEKQSWEPSRIADRIYRREYNRLIDRLGDSMPKYTENVAEETATI